jgi:hypothetical protein
MNQPSNRLHNQCLEKGKSVLSSDLGFKCSAKVSDGRQKNSVKWSCSAEGMAKLNTNGSFVSMQICMKLVLA